MNKYERYTEKFIKEYQGNIYNCSRSITVNEKKEESRQVINVENIGSKTDPASYGRNGHHVESMKGVAELIAGEIILKHLSNNPS